MTGKKTGKRLLTWVLVLVMALSLLPLNVLAANSGSGMNFDKRADSNDDGTYTITMTAQATGTTTTTSKAVPMDIVLVLDQSGSMKENFGSGTRQSAMKEAVNSFIGEVAKKCREGADHRIAIVTFGSDAETLKDWTAVNSTGETELTDKISGLPKEPSGATNIGAGMELAQTLMNSSEAGADRLKTVIVFTDGVPTTSSDFNTTVANIAISAAKDMKGSGVTIYTVGIFNGANPNQLHGDEWAYLIYPDVSCNGEPGSYWGGSWAADLFGSNDFAPIDVPAGNRFLNYLSSNSDDASEIGITKGRYDPRNTYVKGDGWRIDENADCTTTKGYYMTASTASSLNGIFKTISDTVPAPGNPALDEKTVITDTLSNYFTFATGTAADVKVYAGQDELINGEDITVNLNPTTKTVTVTGYDFSKHHTTSDDPKELVIKIKVKPSGDGCREEEIPTNKGDATVTLDNKEINKATPPTVDGYSVEYKIDVDDGVSWPNNEAPEKLYYPKDVTITVTDKVPTREGFEFTGWKSDIEDDDKVYTYNGTNSFTMPAANVVLTPKWTKNTAPILSVEKTVTSIGGKTPVTDDTTGKITTVAYPGDEIVWTITVTNSGNAAGNFTLRDVLKGRTDELTVSPAMAEGANSYTIAPKNPTTGKPTTMTFTVTYTVQPADVTGNGLVNTVTMNDDDEVSSDPVPTAQKYTVTYAYTGTIPTDAPAVPVAAQHEYGAEVTIAHVPTLTGYTFHGWTLPEGLTENGGKFNMPAGDVTITGYWTKNTIPTYTFDLNNQNIIKVDKKFVSKYGCSATRSFTATATIEKKDTFTAEVDSDLPINPYPDNRSAVTGEPTYTNVGEVTGTVTLETDKKPKAFDFGKNSTIPLKPGAYRITVEETNKGNDRYVEYDTEPYTHTYEFTVDNDGKISINKPITFTITNEYTKRHTAATPSKPTLNTGDHYAYVMGYPDGTVRPNGSITRAEVSAILFRLLSDKTRDEYFTTESSFTDVKAGAWYNNSIATLEKAGVIVDTAKGGAFRPNEAITRAELAAMLAQFSDAKPVKGVKFSDVPAEHWAYEAIAIAAKMGWIEGYPDGTFRPDATITRAEMMTLVNRALERVPSDEDHLLSKRVMLTFPDCKSGDWFYIAVQEATNSHTYERAATEKNGDEQWTALRANRDWTLLEK